MTKEMWKYIPGFDKKYQVSSLGNVRTLMKSPTNLRGAPRLLKQHCHRSNTYSKVHLAKNSNTVALRKNKIPVTKYVHLLVLEAFVGKRPKSKEASHLNGNAYDNRATNLKWETRPENQARKLQHGTALIGSKNHKTNLSHEEVIAIRCLRKRGYQCKFIAKLFGVTPGWVNMICANPKKFRKYIEE